MAVRVAFLLLPLLIFYSSAEYYITDDYFIGTTKATKSKETYVVSANHSNLVKMYRQ